MRSDWNANPESEEWEDCLDLLRAEGWDVDLSDHGGALVQLYGRVPDGKLFYVRGKYDFVELDVGADPPPGEWGGEITYDRAGYLKGPEALPIIRELYSQYLAARAPHRDKWCLRGDATPLTGDQAAALIKQRLAEQSLTTWFDHADGPSLRITTNGERATVTLSGTPDAGHAVIPQEPGSQAGYPAENGQDGTCENRDTLPLEMACWTITCIVDFGYWGIGLEVAQ